MSKRKTRKEKLKQEQRNKTRKSQISELEELKSKALQLESKIIEQKKENFKQLNIRNLKVFVSTCNFLAPFVISANIIIGLFSLFYGGLPFYLDEITKYKVYNLDYQTNGDIAMDDEYITNRWVDNSLPENTLVTYTPWELQDGQYVRYKREYDVGKLITLDLIGAVIDEDYNYITENLEKYKEEKQVTNEINSTEDNNYFLEASLHMLDKENVLKYNETDLKNKVITIIELVLSLGIGGLIAYYRDFSYLYALKRIKNNYIERIEPLESMKQELKETNEKVLSLSKTKGGRN